MFIYKFLLQGRFFACLQFLCCIQRNPLGLILKQLGRKFFIGEGFFIGATSNWFLYVTCKQKNFKQFKQKKLASIVLYTFRLFTDLFFYHSSYEVYKVKKDPFQWTNCREIQFSQIQELHFWTFRKKGGFRMEGLASFIFMLTNPFQYYLSLSAWCVCLFCLFTFIYISISIICFS